MIPMRKSASPLRSDFDAFLFAPIGEDSNNDGMQLSVLSALARQNIDPWEEAARLTCLPSETAIQKLTSLIAVPSRESSPRLNSATIAARLIALLPRQAGPALRSATPPGVGTATHACRSKYVIIYGILMALLFGVQWLANDLATARAHKTPTPISSKVVSQRPSANSDH